MVPVLICLLKNKNNMNNSKEFVLTTPVLLIGFNRPDTISQVFEKIRQAKPSKLYVSIDGPRIEKEGEAELVNQVKEIVKKVDWQCDVNYRFLDKNKGAEINVSSAISWVFEKEEYAIILEDDILASFSFFKFAQGMLIRYKNEERIWRVTGINYFQEQFFNITDDYFFAKWGISWGWATWKRAWNYYDLYKEIPKSHLTSSFLSNISDNKSELVYYKNLFKKMRNRGIGNNTWDYLALYIRRVNQGLDIVPKVNLISNIGEYGFHAKGRSEHHFRKVVENYVVVNHPNEIIRNTTYDNLFFNKYRKLSKSYYFKEVIKNILNVFKNT